MKIGIPRALSYYDFFPFWYGFFTDLGIEVILSDPTTKQTMTTGSSLVVPETCLPVKVYVGHILNLLDKGVEKIFVPSIQSIAPKIYNCSKLRGLPDLIRNVVKRPFTMVEATLDKSEKKQGLYEFLGEIAAYFNISDTERIKKASKNAWKVYNNFHIMRRSGISYKKALKSGDKNVYFIDGRTLFGRADRENCTVDGCHPNDLGFYRMAQKIDKTIKKILSKKKHERDI